jgi:hypothetical protein
MVWKKWKVNAYATKVS